jgi:hypothetical protein
MLTLLNQWWSALCFPEKDEIISYIEKQEIIKDNSILGTHKMRYSQISNFIENLEIPESERRIMLNSLKESDQILYHLSGIQWRLAQWNVLTILFESEKDPLLVIDLTKNIHGQWP